jgi:hypothetical protein
MLIVSIFFLFLCRIQDTTVFYVFLGVLEQNSMIVKNLNVDEIKTTHEQQVTSNGDHKLS